MIPAVTTVRLTGARHRADLPLLVLGPALGTSATALWATCAAELADAFDVVAWDLPGHGYNRVVHDEPFTPSELASGVLRVVDTVLEQRGEPGGSFGYAGVSVGGAVGLHLLLDSPHRVEAAVLLCTGARLGDPDAWRDRTEQVRAAGTASMVGASAERWFAPGFADREPERASALLRALREADDEGYVQVCGALATHDVRPRLGEVTAPVLAVAGGQDTATPPERLREVADGVRDGRFLQLDGVAHLAPAEDPAAVAGLIRHHLLGEPLEPTSGPAAELRRLLATQDAEHLRERPGLDLRTRSLLTLAALVAAGRTDELAARLDAAIAAGVSVEDATEALLHAATWSEASYTRAAFGVAQQVLGDDRGR